MPIYAYRCSACGHAKDVLQKMSDPQLHTCPACGAETFTKQLTAAGFQLKGTGWYATDFKGGPAPTAAAGEGAAGGAGGDGGEKAKATDAAASPSAAGAATAAAAPAPAAAPSSDSGRSAGPAASSKGVSGPGAGH